MEKIAMYIEGIIPSALLIGDINMPNKKLDPEIISCILECIFKKDIIKNNYITYLYKETLKTYDITLLNKNRYVIFCFKKIDSDKLHNLYTLTKLGEKIDTDTYFSLHSILEKTDIN